MAITRCRNAFAVGLSVVWLAAGCASADRLTEPSGNAPVATTPPQAESPSAPPAASSGSVRCAAEKARFAIGERAAPALLERARLAAGAETARFLRPDQRITLEYLDSRLNLQLDDRDIVRSVTCG